MKAYEVFKGFKLIKPKTRARLIALIVVLICVLATPIIIAMNSPYHGWWSAMLIATTYLAVSKINDVVLKWFGPMLFKWVAQDERS